MHQSLPVLIIKDTVLFPGVELHLECDTLEQKQLLSIAESNYNGQLFVVVPSDTLEVNPDLSELPKINVIANIKMKMDMPNGKTRVILEGIKRGYIKQYHDNDNLIDAIYEEIKPQQLDSKEERAYVKALKRQLDTYISTVPYMSNAVLSQIAGVEALDRLSDIVASFFPISITRKLEYIQTKEATTRATMLIDDMNQDLEVLELEEKIDQEVNKQLEKSQKEYVLREKLRVIKEELGEISDKEDEINLLKQRVSRLKCGPKVKDRLQLELHRYEMTSPNSPEVGIIRDYIDWLIHLPWCNYTRDTIDLNQVEKVLNANHYGLEQVKSRILEYLAVKQNTSHSRSPILCLVGPPGVGKTSLAMSIAKSLGRKVAKMSVGGIHDEAEIIGHRRTYVGASPGRIIQGLRKAATTNPVFIIDELDKMTKDIKGDPASALLEVLDPEQNAHFSDHYVEEEFDLSKVLFIATANYQDQIPSELKDRLEMIFISSYTEYEKLDIAQNYLIPKQLEEHGLTQIQVQIDQEAILRLIRYYTKEAGVRELERSIASLFRKIVKIFLMHKEIASYHITKDEVKQLLGTEKYHYTAKEDKKQVGVVNGLAYTPSGGDILPIEATYYKGKGNLLLTGSLGEVMQESAYIAFSYIKAHARTFGIPIELLEKNDAHIHVPEGSIPKDGPSAGITLTTTLISLFKNQAISCNIAMTGEMTLRGNILAIGGLKEKLIGAHRSGIKKIYLPDQNREQLEEIPEEIKRDLTFSFVGRYQDLYQQLFLKERDEKNDDRRRKTTTIKTEIPAVEISSRADAQSSKSKL